MNQEQFEQAVKKAEQRTREYLLASSEEHFDELMVEYPKRGDYLRSLNVKAAWLRFVFRTNRTLLLRVTSAAAAAIVAFVVLFNLSSTDQQTIIADILPAEGVVTVTLPTGDVVAIDQNHSGTTQLKGAAIDYQNQKISYSQPVDGEQQEAEARQPGDEPEVSYHELRIPKGRSYSLVLSDGTEVWVNAESTIRYPAAFASNERTVFVEGEAFFDVVRDDSKPFVVKTKDYSVRVLGTRFNVKCYSDEEFVATTLVSGSVSIPTGLDEEKVIVPGEQLLLSRKDGKVTIDKVDTEVYTSWITNTLTLRQTPLHEVVNQLRRRYDVQFVFEDSSLRNESFTGVVPLNENLNAILSMFSKVSSVEFRVENGVVFIGKSS